LLSTIFLPGVSELPSAWLALLPGFFSLLELDHEQMQLAALQLGAQEHWMLCFCIIDVVFLGDKLYGFTCADRNTPLGVHGLGLFTRAIAFDDHGIPMVTNVRLVIRLDNDSDNWCIIDESDDDDHNAVREK
jgi:hypothetical protein